MHTRSLRTRIYLSVVTASGLALLGWALAGLLELDSERWIASVTVAAVAATIKIRLTGVTATVSCASLVVFVAIARLSMEETVTIAAVAGLAQSFFNVLRRPRAIQVLFSVAALAVSAAASYLICHQLASTPMGVLLSGAVLFFVFNTTLVAGAVSLTQTKPLPGVGRYLARGTMLQYAINAAAAGAVASIAGGGNWRRMFVCVPALAFTWMYSRAIQSNVYFRGANPFHKSNR